MKSQKNYRMIYIQFQLRNQNHCLKGQRLMPYLIKMATVVIIPLIKYQNLKVDVYKFFKFYPHQPDTLRINTRTIYF